MVLRAADRAVPVREAMSSPRSRSGTKESIGHGVGFWPSEITFPGNIANIEAFVVANGVEYDDSTVAKGEDGFWAVADATTGATLAGTPNYLRIAKAAYENATK